MPSKINWIISQPIDARRAAQDVGFSIDRLHAFNPAMQKSLKSKTISEILRLLDDDWEDQREDKRWTQLTPKLSSVKRGAYILCLDRGLCVNYGSKKSRVLYIGKGAIRQRLKIHLQHKLLEMFEALPGLKFRVWMTEPKKAGSIDYWHEFEADLLNNFSVLYGSGSDIKPLFNKNKAPAHDRKHKHPKDWNRALLNKGAKYKWALSSASVTAKDRFQD